MISTVSIYIIVGTYQSCVNIECAIPMYVYYIICLFDFFTVHSDKTSICRMSICHSIITNKYYILYDVWSDDGL